MSYRERPSPVFGATLWQRDVEPAPVRTRILPDGCLDVVWDGARLLVAGPDSRAREHLSPAGTSYAALRLAAGTGPALLGVPADALRDRTVRLAALWPVGQARELTERVAADPVAGLQRWAAAGHLPVDPLGPALWALAGSGTPVTAMADRLGVGTRQLHRRCLALFGYGPRRLARVLRLTRALREARSGLPLAQVAYACGFADQAHLSREVRELAGTTPSVLLRESAGG